MLRSPLWVFGLISGFSMGNLATINVFPLFFADDMNIFCDNDCKQMLKLWFDALV